MYNLKVLTFMLVATVLAYLTHLFLKANIDPRRSGAHFLMYVLAHLVSIVFWVFLFSLAIIHFRDWFFKH